MIDAAIDYERSFQLLKTIGWSVGECARRLHIHPTSLHRMQHGQMPMRPEIMAWLEELAALPDLRSLPDGWPEPNKDRYRGFVMRNASKSPLLRAIGWSDMECAQRLGVHAGVIFRMARGDAPMDRQIQAWLERLAALPQLHSLPVGWRLPEAA